VVNFRSSNNNNNNNNNNNEECECLIWDNCLSCCVRWRSMVWLCVRRSSVWFEWVEFGAASASWCMQWHLQSRCYSACCAWATCCLLLSPGQSVSQSSHCL